MPWSRCDDEADMAVDRNEGGMGEDNGSGDCDFATGLTVGLETETETEFSRERDRVKACPDKA